LITTGSRYIRGDVKGEINMGEVLTLQLPGHMETISQKAWEKLFAYIPAFENLTKEDLAYNHDWASIPKIKEEFDEFYHLIYEIQLIINFNWGFWSYEERMIAGDADLSEFSPIELCMMLTRIVRGDRFNQNYLAGCIVDGSVSNILKGLRHYYG
jgi:hypothetical protein